jgi:hypothetical protein
MDWIDLAQNKDRWRAVVNAEMHFQDPQKMVNFLTDNLLACQEIL